MPQRHDELAVLCRNLAVSCAATCRPWRMTFSQGVDNVPQARHLLSPTRPRSKMGAAELKSIPRPYIVGGRL